MRLATWIVLTSWGYWLLIMLTVHLVSTRRPTKVTQAQLPRPSTQIVRGPGGRFQKAGEPPCPTPESHPSLFTKGRTYQEPDTSAGD